MAEKIPKIVAEHVERRHGTIRELLARGLFDYQIIDACLAHERQLFHKPSGEPLARATIRKYIYTVRGMLRTALDVDTDEEFAKAVMRIQTAYRLAETDRKPQAMVAAIREFNRMFGFRRQPKTSEPFDAQQVHDQLEDMEESVTDGEE